MLALNLIKQRGGHFAVTAIKLILGGTIKRFHITRDIGGVTAFAAPSATGSEQYRASGDGKKGEFDGRFCEHGRCYNHRLHERQVKQVSFPHNACTIMRFDA